MYDVGHAWDLGHGCSVDRFYGDGLYISPDAEFWSLDSSGQRKFLSELRQRISQFGTFCTVAGLHDAGAGSRDICEMIIRRPVRKAFESICANEFADDYLKEWAQSCLADLRLWLGRRIAKRKGFKLPSGRRWAEKRMAVERDGGKCRYCGAEVGHDFHLDHVIPKAYGGSDKHSNLVVACPKCNLKKNGRTPAEAGMRLSPAPALEVCGSV